MPSKISRSDVDAILKLTRQPLEAETGEAFFEAVRRSYDELHKGLVRKASRRMLDALEEAQSHCHLRQRRILDVCSWPIFDKPAMPGSDPDALPEFLWIFCIPFVVQFSPEAIKKPIFFSDELFDGRTVLRKMIGNNCLNPKAMVAGFPTLMSREDLHSMGPCNLATAFIQAELGGTANLQPMPRELDAEVESGRLSTYFMVAAARLPAGEKQLFTGGAWPGDELANLVTEGMRARGVDVEQVLSLPACSITESLFRCTQVGTTELNRILDLAKELYSIREVELLLPADGMAELSGYDEAGESFVLCSPFSYVEPKSEVRAWVESLCKDKSLSFTAASLAIPTSSMMH